MHTAAQPLLSRWRWQSCLPEARDWNVIRVFTLTHTASRSHSSLLKREQTS